LIILDSLYLTLTTIGTPSAIVGSTLGQTTISCLVTITRSTPLHILKPELRLLIQHNKLEV
jgi:hypothetical protein